MKTTTRTTAYFDCSLERAFRIPILGDATKFLTGFFVIPAVTHFTEDRTWGQEGGSRIPHSAKNLFSNGGEVGFDQILEREENKYWKWELGDFRQWSMGFVKFQGELFCEQVGEDRILVTWTYSLYSSSKITYPIHYLFTKLLWKVNMDRAIARIKLIAESDAELVYN